MRTLPEVNEILIHRTCGQNGGKIEDVLFTAAESRLNIVLEKEAELTLIERHCSEKEQEKVVNIGVLLKEGAKLHHYRFQEDDITAKHRTSLAVSLAENAFYEAITLTKGAVDSQCDVEADLLGEQASCVFKEIKLLSGQQKGASSFVVRHDSPDCTSSLECRSVLNDTALGIFDGITRVNKEADGTKASQLSKAVLLSDGTEMRAKPELQIYTDDVACAHGATTGQLDEEQLFYLRARGIPEADARAILIEAFLCEVVDKIVDESVKNEIKVKIGSVL